MPSEFDLDADPQYVIANYPLRTITMRLTASAISKKVVVNGWDIEQ